MVFFSVYQKAKNARLKISYDRISLKYYIKDINDPIKIGA